MTVSKEDLRTLVAGVFEVGIDELTDEVRFGDELGVDSLMLLDTAARIQARFGVQVSETEINETESFREVYDLVLRNQRAGA